jgi:hypothetical protein
MNRQFSAGPIDASRFNPALGQVHGVRLLSTDYVAGIYQWQPIDAAGALISSAIFGTNVDPENIAEIAADDHIRADIARTLE